MEEIKMARNKRSKIIMGVAVMLMIVALIATIIFSYDEKRKCSNNKGFLLATV